MDIENQIIKLDIQIEENAQLAAATIIHFTLANILHQQKLPFATLPEIVELAVIGTGLGMPRNQIEFVKHVPSFWDSTVWTAVERPFLDEQALAYANSLSAWMRGERNSDWISSLPAQLKKPMQKSLKYLHKTKDTFVRTDTTVAASEQTEAEWLQAAQSSGITEQIIAIRNLQPNEHLASEHEETLLPKLRSVNRFLILHSIAAIEFLQLDSQSIKSELTHLAETTDDEVRSKAMIALARLEPINEFAYEQALKMLGSRSKHVCFAGIVGLLSHDSVEAGSLRVVDNGFRQALQTCDYEFVGLFAAAYNKWLDEPQDHVTSLLEGDHPEYLQIAIDAVAGAKQQQA